MWPSNQFEFETPGLQPRIALIKMIFKLGKISQTQMLNICKILFSLTFAELLQTKWDLKVVIVIKTGGRYSEVIVSCP
jgi:hypothetical protein